MSHPHENGNPDALRFFIERVYFVVSFLNIVERLQTGFHLDLLKADWPGIGLNSLRYMEFF
jgi:hypothetical protein